MIEEGLINQVYQTEKEFLAAKGQYEAYLNSEMQTMQQKKVFEYSLESLKELKSDRVYQPVGKAFLARKKENMIDDFEYLLNKAEEDLKACSNYRQQFEKKKNDLQKQLVEMTKGLKINK